MLQAITAEVWKRIENPTFRSYVQCYLDIEDDFQKQVEAFGVPFSSEPSVDMLHGSQVACLRESGVSIDNDAKSLSVGWVSPACVTCRKGVGTTTFLTSVQCPRSCFFCFNPNQENYDYYLHHVHDVASELEKQHAAGAQYDDLALTGGEPLLHKEQTRAFFERATQLYPQAYTRLYTSGAFLDEAFLEVLQNAGLDEIRFSIKTDEPQAAQDAVLEAMRLSRSYIPHVMVEMPVMPDEVDVMRRLLDTLDGIGIDGINLLELCFPLHNGEEFAKRGYQLKATPYRVLYNYWYAGGVPVAGSEEACLELLAYALEKHYAMGVHYCSLENKFSGQIFRQNYPYKDAFPTSLFSQRDYFLKTVKAFGDDAALVRVWLCEKGCAHYRFDRDDGYVEFHPEYVGALAAEFPQMEVGVSYAVVETDEDTGAAGGSANGSSTAALRELRVDYARLAQMSPVS